MIKVLALLNSNTFHNDRFTLVASKLATTASTKHRLQVVCNRIYRQRIWSNMRNQPKLIFSSRRQECVEGDVVPTRLDG